MNQNTIDNKLTYDKLSVTDRSTSKIDAKHKTANLAPKVLYLSLRARC
jgi:hypothetical protein